MSVTISVPAKINLALAVGKRRSDGYHELQTVFHAVDLKDTLQCQIPANGPANQISLEITGQHFGLASDASNLAIKAAILLRERYGHPGLGVAMRLDKQIPIAGGMAGGSADAAGALVGCNRLWNLACSKDQLIDLASQLGSDVPFSLIGGTALGHGRGEILEPLADNTAGQLIWVLALSKQQLSTPEVYRRYDQLYPNGGDLSRPQTLIDALAKANIELLAENLRNDLEPAALDLAPSLARTLQTGREAGALAGMVSGSGPSCAFLTGSLADARRVAAQLAKLADVRDTKIATGSVTGPLTSS